MRLTGIELNFLSRPARSLVAAPTELHKNIILGGVRAFILNARRMFMGIHISLKIYSNTQLQVCILHYNSTTFVTYI
jgi:hypothetical protein